MRGPASPAARLFRHRFHAMGCPAEIFCYAEHPEAAWVAVQAAVDESDRLERKYSHHRDDSLLARIVRAAAAPGGAVVDPETASLLDFGAAQFRESGGRFDITAGALTRLWDRIDTLPSPACLERALALTGWRRVQWNGARLRLPEGMQLDLGAIVKEYAVDRAALAMRNLGITSGYIDLGGDLRVLGPHPDGQPWRIGIRHPRRDSAAGCLLVPHGGLASSGDYERCALIDGKRYGHIIDARSGWPVQGLASVSVVAPTCLVAGALSTLALLHPVAEALALLERSGLAWLAHDGHFSFSGGDGMLHTLTKAPEPATRDNDGSVHHAVSPPERASDPRPARTRSGAWQLPAR